MKISSLSELKKELSYLPEKELIALCIALAKYKKDNKEYLDYLLYSAANKDEFIREVKSEMDLQFGSLDPSLNLYYTKKSLRKILRMVNKFCKYLGDKSHSVELHMYYCLKLKNSGIPYRKSQQLVNLFDRELLKIKALIETLHEDLQGDYSSEWEALSGN